MKVFIEKSEDGLFLKTDFVWVSLKEEAKAFANCTPAINYCVEHGIRNVKLRLSFGDSRYDLPVEIFRGKAKRLPRRVPEQALQKLRKPICAQRGNGI
jgi:hypothetical protein